MVSIRRGWLVAVLALGVGIAGCKKDEVKSDQASGDKAGGGKASSPAAADDLSLLPADSEMVMGLNFAQLQQSALWKQFVEPKLMGEMQSNLTEFKDKCGFDPMAAIKSVSVGLKGLGGGKPEGVIVVHGGDKSKVLDCLDKAKDELQQKNKMQVTRDGDVVMFKNDNGDAAMTFINDSTSLVVLGPNATKDGVKAVVAGSSALKTSAAFVDMYSKINASDSLWMLMNGNSKLFEKAAMLGPKPKAMFGSLNVTDGLALDLRIRLDTPDAAAALATQANGQAKMAQGMVDKLAITSEGPDMKVSIVLSTQKLQALITQFGGMLGGMGGMGGTGH